MASRHTTGTDFDGNRDGLEPEYSITRHSCGGVVLVSVNTGADHYWLYRRNTGVGFSSAPYLPSVSKLHIRSIHSLYIESDNFIFLNYLDHILSR